MEHWRLGSVDEVESEFDARTLAELAVAEHEAPWGPMAENYRMMYLVNMTQACLSGDKDSQREAVEAARRIWIKLFGIQPTRGEVNLKDLIGNDGQD